MSIEQAASLLDKKLRPFPWYVSTGIGQTTAGPVLFVYVKSPRQYELSGIASDWMSYKVVVRKVGSVRMVDVVPTNQLSHGAFPS